MKGEDDLTVEDDYTGEGGYREGDYTGEDD